MITNRRRRRAERGRPLARHRALSPLAYRRCAVDAPGCASALSHAAPVRSGKGSAMHADMQTWMQSARRTGRLSRHRRRDPGPWQSAAETTCMHPDDRRPGRRHGAGVLRLSDAAATGRPGDKVTAGEYKGQRREALGSPIAITLLRTMRLRTVVRKLEAEHPAGLSAGELFLANADLLPTPEEKKTWGHWSFVSFWIADSFVRPPVSLPWHCDEPRLTSEHQHVHDRVVHDHGRADVVAGADVSSPLHGAVADMELRHRRVRAGRPAARPERAARCAVGPDVPGREPDDVRGVRVAVARVQPGRDGVHLVGRRGVDRRVQVSRQLGRSVTGEPLPAAHCALGTHH